MLNHCPVCGASFSLDVLVEHEAARLSLSEAFELPGELGNLLTMYIVLFRPKQRHLTFSRVHALLEPLLESIKQHTVRRNGVDWPASNEMWATALSDVIQRGREGSLSLPLKNHGYLFQVIADYSNRTDGLTGIGGAVHKILNNQTPEGKARGLAGMKAALSKTENPKGKQND